MSLRCRNCGAVWPDELEAEWGRNRESSGYGESPKCVKLVTDRRTNAGQLCAGRLMDSTAAATEKVHTLDGELIA